MGFEDDPQHRALDLVVPFDVEDTREPWGYDKRDFEWVWQVAVALERGVVLWCATEVKRKTVVAGCDVYGTYCVMVEDWPHPCVALTAFEVARAFVHLVGWQMAGFCADDGCADQGRSEIPFLGC